jgi:flagellar basal-body rod modification protein FlgD
MTMAIEPTAATGSSSAPPTDRNRIGLADQFDSFLLLLTAQLKSQDPLSPMDANQFTQQLVQFTGVEQAIKTNETLSQLASMMRADQLSRGIEYLGAEVEARTETIRLGPDGGALASYRLDQPAAEVAIGIYDDAGDLVAIMAGENRAGQHEIQWDGRDQNGTRLPEGLYRIEVQALDAAGESVPVDTTIAGAVDGVELIGERLMLSVEGVLLPVEALTAIRRPVAS